MMWSAPATDSILATSLAEIGARLCNVKLIMGLFMYIYFIHNIVKSAVVLLVACLICDIKIASSSPLSEP